MPRSARIDLRKPQIALLRYEKTLAASAAALAAAGAAAARAEEAGMGDAFAGAFADLQAAHLDLAETVQRAHDALQAKAVGACAHLVDGGLPKDPAVSVLGAVKSALGLG